MKLGCYCAINVWGGLFLGKNNDYIPIIIRACPNSTNFLFLESSTNFLFLKLQLLLPKYLTFLKKYVKIQIGLKITLTLNGDDAMNEKEILP